MDSRNERTETEQEKMRHNLGQIAEAVDAGKIEGISPKILEGLGASKSRAQEIFDYLKNNGALSEKKSSRLGRALPGHVQAYVVDRPRLQKLIDERSSELPLEIREIKEIDVEGIVVAERAENDQEIREGASAVHHGGAESVESKRLMDEAADQLREKTEQEAEILRGKAAFEEGMASIVRASLVAGIAFAPGFNQQLQETFFENGAEVIRELLGNLEDCLRLTHANLDAFAIEFFPDASEPHFLGEHSIGLGVQAIRTESLPKTTKTLNRLTFRIAKVQVEERERKAVEEAAVEREKIRLASLPAKTKRISPEPASKPAPSELPPWFAEPELAATSAPEPKPVKEEPPITPAPEAIHPRPETTTPLPENLEKSTGELGELEDWEMDLVRTLFYAEGFTLPDEEIRRAFSQILEDYRRARQRPLLSASEYLEQLFKVPPDPALVARWEAKYGARQGQSEADQDYFRFEPEPEDLAREKAKIEEWETVFGEVTISDTAKEWANAGKNPGVGALIEATDEFVRLLSKDRELAPKLSKYGLYVHGQESDKVSRAGIDCSAAGLLGKGPVQTAEFFNAELRKQEGLPEKKTIGEGAWEANMDHWKTIFRDVTITPEARALIVSSSPVEGQGERRFFEDMAELTALLSENAIAGPLLSQYALSIDDDEMSGTRTGIIHLGIQNLRNRGSEAVANFLISRIRTIAKEEAHDSEREPALPPLPGKKEGDPAEAEREAMEIMDRLNRTYAQFDIRPTAPSSPAEFENMLGQLRMIESLVYPTILLLVKLDARVRLELMGRPASRLWVYLRLGSGTVVISSSDTNESIIARVRELLVQNPQFAAEAGAAAQPEDAAEDPLAALLRLNERHGAFFQTSLADISRLEDIAANVDMIRRLDEEIYPAVVPLMRTGASISVDISDFTGIYRGRIGQPDYDCDCLAINRLDASGIIIRKIREFLDQHPECKIGSAEPLEDQEPPEPVDKERGGEKPMTLDEAREAYAEAYGKYLRTHKNGDTRIDHVPAVEAARAKYDACLKVAAERMRIRERNRVMNRELAQGRPAHPMDVALNEEITTVANKKILEELVMAEERRINDLKIGKMPPEEKNWVQEHWQKMWMAYARMPRWKRIAMSTVVGGSVAVASGSVAGWMILGYAGKKVVAASMGAGSSMAIDALDKRKDAKQLHIDQLLKKHTEDISHNLDQMRMGYGEILERQAQHEKRLMFLKAGLAAVLGIGTSVAGGIALHEVTSGTGGGTHVLTHHQVNQPSKTAPQQPAPRELEQTPKPEIANHPTETTAPSGAVRAVAPKSDALPEARFGGSTHMGDQRVTEQNNVPHMGGPRIQTEQNNDVPHMGSLRIPQQDNIPHMGQPRISEPNNVPHMGGPRVQVPSETMPHMGDPRPQASPSNVPHMGEPRVAPSPFEPHVESTFATGTQNGSAHGTVGNAEHAIPAGQDHLSSTVKDSIGKWNGNDPMQGEKIMDQLGDLNKLTVPDRRDFLLSVANKAGYGAGENINVDDVAAFSRTLKDMLIAYPEAEHLGFKNYGEYLGVRDMKVSDFLKQLPKDNNKAILSALRLSESNHPTMIGQLSGTKQAIPLRSEHVTLGETLSKVIKSGDLDRTVGQTLVERSQAVVQESPKLLAKMAKLLKNVSQ